MRNLLAFVCVLLLATGGLAAEPETNKVFKLKIGSRQRSYRLIAPASTEKRIPLVIVLHGDGGNADQAEKEYGFTDKARREGFVVAYPDGSSKDNNPKHTWNSGFGWGYAYENNIDDIGFIKAMIADIRNVRLPRRIDSQRIFVAGISNGGVLAHIIGAHLSDQVAAIAAVAAVVSGKESPDAKPYVPPVPSQPVSMIAFHGLMDTHLPYYGGRQIDSPEENQPKKIICTAHESVAFWLRANKITGAPVTEILPGGEGMKNTFANKEAGTEVQLYSLFKSGHVWPGASRGSGKDNQATGSIVATDLIWKFFKAHPQVPKNPAVPSDGGM